MGMSYVMLKSLLFGISMETELETGTEISSGIVWNQCIYMKNEGILMMYSLSLINCEL